MIVPSPSMSARRDGPLFLKRHDRYVCIGINTQKLMEAEGLGFAIDIGIVDTGRLE